jgi:bacterioferritin
MIHMVEKIKPLSNTCNFSGIKPIMMDLPYPPIQVKEKNRAYADLLSVDYCGSVSELSAITQYINNENRLSYGMCQTAQTLLGIASAEMVHLQKLGEMIILLGGQVDFIAKMRGGRRQMWTPGYLNIPDNVKKMLLADMEAEKAAINQYEAHIRMINDCYVNAVLARIIKDEEYHLMLLQTLLEEVDYA